MSANLPGEEQVLPGAEPLRAVIDGVDDAIFILNVDMVCAYCNQKIRDWLCLSDTDLPEAKQKPITALFGDELSAQAFHLQYQQALIEGTGYLECHIAPAGGESRWLEIKLNRVELDETSWVIVVARDISARHSQLKDAEHQATHDLLTGLPNWNSLGKQIEKIMEVAREQGDSLALYNIDLVRFREISNILGPKISDQVLRLVARRLQKGLPDKALISRNGGDVFSVLLPGVDRDQASQWASRISVMLLRSYDLGELSGVDYGNGDTDMGMDIDFSIGIALYPEHDIEIDDLLRKSGVAAQIARSQNSGVAFYDRQFDRRDADRLLLAGQLRRAIAEDSIAVHFQPIVDIKSRTLTGVECQARWNHPQRGDVSPDQFIPLAEQTGLIRLLDHWVMEQALKQCSAWHEQGIRLVISVNLSTRTLDDPQLVQAVQEGVQRWNIDARCLRLEITESALMANPEQSLEKLQGLTAEGVTIALDDFGTGYSSLAYLKKLPLDCLKIDQSFVKDMQRDESDAVIVRSTIELAHNLGLSVVAEGVEDEATWRMLAALGCDSAQGWYVSKAMPVEELSNWLLESPWARSL